MWQSKTDDALAHDVRAALDWTPSVASANVHVEAKDGVVTLSGAVPSHAMRAAAERQVERVSGVRAVVQHLEVRVPEYHARDDAAIAGAAADALHWDVEVPDGRVRASVSNGVVTLGGQVDSRYQADAAERAVQSLTGVTGVTNHIRVLPAASAADVRQRITATLERGAGPELDRVTIEANDGTVTLRGSVHSWSAREEVRAAARAAPGVGRVVDELTIGP